MNSKKDQQSFKPDKVFTSMYQKAYQSRKFEGEERPTLNSTSEAEEGRMNENMRVKSAKRPNLFEVLGRSQSRLAATAAVGLRNIETESPLAGKNNYSPDFVSTLNFNFNTNDVFGAKVKKSAAHSLLRSK
jgi:hypothetical protein